MSINRTDFFESLARSSPELGLIFLNHTGPPAKLLTDTTSIELLASKSVYEKFIAYCKSHPLVLEIIIYPQFKRKKILVEFQDGSELCFTLVKAMLRRTIVLQDATAIRKKAFVNEFGLFVPAHEHHFEYQILKCQFDKTIPSDRFQNYASTFSVQLRSTIFKYIQEHYNPVFNTLEDLFTPKPNMLLTIIIGLRGEKKNTLLRMFLRSFELGVYKMFGWMIQKEIRISASKDPSHAPEVPSENKRNSERRAIL